MTIEIKPTTFARGVPKEQNNGFYGIEEKLLELPLDTQITAVVTFRFKDDITKRGEGVRYPVISIDHIEPIWDEISAGAVQAAQQESYKARTGANELSFDFDDDSDAGDVDDDDRGSGAGEQDIPTIGKRGRK